MEKKGRKRFRPTRRKDSRFRSTRRELRRIPEKFGSSKRMKYRRRPRREFDMESFLDLLQEEPEKAIIFSPDMELGVDTLVQDKKGNTLPYLKLPEEYQLLVEIHAPRLRRILVRGRNWFYKCKGCNGYSYTRIPRIRQEIPDEKYHTPHVELARLLLPRIKNRYLFVPLPKPLLERLPPLGIPEKEIEKEQGS